MTIDEAIEHARDVAKSNIVMYKSHVRMSIKDNTEKFNNPSCLKCAEEHEQLADWLEQLKEYQQLEEQGRLVKLPCKVGDTVYHVVQGIIVEVSNVDLFFLLLSVVENRFNNSVFLTKSEAKAKLKELRGGNNGKGR